MTTYSVAALGNAQIAYKKGITLQQIRQLRDNIIAITEGDVTAPDISRLGLKTATNSVSGTLASGATLRVSMDAWSFAPDIKCEVAFAITSSFPGTAGADTPGFNITQSSGSGRLYSVAWRSLVA